MIWIDVKELAGAAAIDFHFLHQRRDTRSGEDAHDRHDRMAKSRGRLGNTGNHQQITGHGKEQTTPGDGPGRKYPSAGRQGQQNHEEAPQHELRNASLHR